MDTLEKQIRTYIAQNILFTGNENPYTDDISFLDQGIVDSMNVLELVNFVEERYNLKVDDREMNANAQGQHIDQWAAFGLDIDVPCCTNMLVKHLL